MMVGYHAELNLVPIGATRLSTVRPPRKESLVMPKAVKFDAYGGLDVLEVRDVPRPIAAKGKVLVRVIS